MVTGAIVGGSGVLGSVGVGGLPAIISIKSQFWGVFGIATLISMVVPAVLTIIFAKLSREKRK